MSNIHDRRLEETEQLAERMRILKKVVIILGILLVLAMIGTIAGIIYKSHLASVASGQNPGEGVAANGFAAGGFGMATLPLSPECRVANATANGDRLIVVVAGPTDNCRVVLIGDLKTGKLLGQIGFQPAQ